MANALYPKAKEASKMLTVDLERIAVWKAKGAQFSSTVEQLLKANAKTAS